MNLKRFLFLSAVVSAALVYKKQNNTVTMLPEVFDNNESNIAKTLVAQQINCNAAKEIIIMADLTGFADSAWVNYAMPSILKLVRSFNVSTSAVRFEIYSRSSTAYNGYWCINVELFSNANSNINALISILQARPCNVLSPGGLSTVWGTVYGSRRSNIPVEILVLTDWLHHNGGINLFDVDRIKALGGVRFVCAGVGSAVDYGYLGTICGNNIIKISNYGVIINSVDQIASNLCNGINVPTIMAPTIVPSLVPSVSITATPATNSPVIAPAAVPTIKPSPLMTFNPTKLPTKRPTNYPTKLQRTNYPTIAKPTSYPTIVTTNPTNKPIAKRFRNLLL